MKPRLQACLVLAVLAALLLSGCGPFSGTRYDYPWAHEYNYLKGQRTPPEEIGILTTNVGGRVLTYWPEGIVGKSKVTLPLRLGGGAITTPVEINGQKRVAAVLDTGAPFNLVSLTVAYNLNLPVTRPKTLPQKIYGYGGASTDCGWSILRSLQFGDFSYANALTCISLEKFDQVTFFGFVTLSRDEWFILGLSSMAKMSYMTFDFRRGLLTLDRDGVYPPPTDSDTVVAACRVNPGFTLTTHIQVDGRGPYPCRIDTGKTVKAPALTIPHKLAQELGYWRETGGRRSDQVGIGGRFESQRFRIKNFTLGGNEFTNLTADSHDGANEFILGASFLRSYKTTVDFRRQQLYLER